MALTKVVNADQMGESRPTKSALQTFASVLNMGTQGLGLAGNALGTLAGGEPKPAEFNASEQAPRNLPPGTFTLGEDPNSTWTKLMANPYFSNVGVRANPNAPSLIQGTNTGTSLVR